MIHQGIANANVSNMLKRNLATTAYHKLDMTQQNLVKLSF